MATTPITTDKFDSVVSGSAKPVLVDFWASWCGPCRALGPVVEEISGELSDKLDVYKCNVDEEADLATRFRIVSIPTLILGIFGHRRLRDREVAAQVAQHAYHGRWGACAACVGEGSGTPPAARSRSRWCDGPCHRICRIGGARGVDGGADDPL